MDKQNIKLDILITAIIHDLGKVSYQYFLSKTHDSNLPDSHGYILVKLYPHIKEILNAPTRWAPDITYLDIMTKHHQSYITNKNLRKFKEADRYERSKHLAMPPTHTRQTDQRYIYTLDYLGNKSICDMKNIPFYQKTLISNLKYLIQGTKYDKIKIIKDIYYPILTKCPTDNRPGRAVSLWDHSIEVYLALISATPVHPIRLLASPHSLLFHAYGSLPLFCKLKDTYNTLLSASAYYTLLYIKEILDGIRKHLKNLPHSNETHRYFYVKRNTILLEEIAQEISHQQIQDIFRNVFGIMKPPSISTVAIPLIIQYLKLRYDYRYTHEGSLFHLFFRRKITSADVIQILRSEIRGPWESWLAIPADTLSIKRIAQNHPANWTFTSKHHGIKIKHGIYITQTPSHILFNQSKILFKGIGKKGNDFTINR